MPTIGSNSKPAYVYDAGTDTWIPIGPGEHTHDYSASNHDHNATYIAKTLTTTTGDIIYASAANTPARLGIGSTNQVLTVSDGVPVWAAPAAGSFVGCRLSNSTNPTISNGTYTLRTYDQETFDTDGFHSTVSNTGRITIPSGKGGYYKVFSTNNWFDNTTGQRITAIYKNGGAEYYGYMAPGIAVASSISVIMNLSVGDYIETYVYQGSGGNLQIYAGTAVSWFEVNYLGA